MLPPTLQFPNRPTCISLRARAGHSSAVHRRSSWRFWILEDVASWEELLEQGLSYESVVQRLSSYHQNLALLAAFMSTAVCSTLFDREWDFGESLSTHPNSVSLFVLTGGIALTCMLIILVLCVMIDNTVQRVPGDFYLRAYLKAFGLTLSAILPLALLSVVLLGVHLAALLLMHGDFHWSTILVVCLSGTVVVVVMKVKINTTRFLQDASRHVTRAGLASSVVSMQVPGVNMRKSRGRTSVMDVKGRTTSTKSCGSKSFGSKSFGSSSSISSDQGPADFALQLTPAAAGFAPAADPAAPPALRFPVNLTACRWSTRPAPEEGEEDYTPRSVVGPITTPRCQGASCDSLEGDLPLVDQDDGHYMWTPRRRSTHAGRSSHADSLSAPKGGRLSICGRLAPKCGSTTRALSMRLPRQRSYSFGTMTSNL